MQTGAEVQSHSQASFSRLIEQRAEHRAHQQRGAEVGEEDQDAAQPSAQLCLEFGVHDAVHAFAKSLCAAGFFHQLDKAANEYDQHQYACVVRVGELDEKVIADHGVHRRKRVAAAEDQRTHKAAAK